uniref:Potassium channel tetramerisation-type BTB domain-containing protein n=1 Tax=Meloidogyne javanica TaxID=6303 RepID=A0A915N8L7_MELJA
MFKKDEKEEEENTTTTTTTNLINYSLKESTSCGDQQHEIVKRQVSNSLDVEMGQPRSNTTGTASSTIDKRSTSQHNQLQEKASLKSSLKIEDTILRLNIGGSSYRIRTRSILKHGADTLLGRFIRMDEQHRRAWADAYFEEESEYFFERVPRYFDPVYDFYASGKLHVPKDLCFDKFMAEEKDHFIGLRCAKVRRRLWLILEGHSNSKWWKFFEITSTSFVVLSITALILASMPEFQVPDNSNQLNTMSLGKHSTNPTYPKVSGFTISTTTVVKDGEEHRIEMIEHPVFNYVENICGNWAFLTVRLLRVLRVVRIAKLGRFSPGLANFALTLQRSKKQMQMVAIVLLTGGCLFSQTKWVPQTASGKIVGGGAIICGVLVLALPIAILVNNFMQVVRLREEKLIRQQYYVTNTASGGSIVGGEHRV